MCALSKKVVTTTTTTGTTGTTTTVADVVADGEATQKSDPCLKANLQAVRLSLCPCLGTAGAVCSLCFWRQISLDTGNAVCYHFWEQLEWNEGQDVLASLLSALHNKQLNFN